MNVENERTKDLVTGLLSDAKDLAVGELGRMKSEITDELKNLKRYMLEVGIAVGVVVVGAVLIGHAVAVGLVALGVPAWLAYVLAAVIMIGVGVIILKTRHVKRSDIDLVPEESMHRLERDLRQMRDAVRH